MILEQRLVKRANAALHCRETSLRLSDEGDELVLIRYIEHYSPGSGQWVEYSYSVPVCEFTQWIMANGAGQAKNRQCHRWGLF